jgi:hypothetical protein
MEGMIEPTRLVFITLARGLTWVRKAVQIRPSIAQQLGLRVRSPATSMSTTLVVVLKIRIGGQGVDDIDEGAHCRSRYN